MERANHARHIFYGRVFYFPFNDRTFRLALKINNYKIAAGIQHLPQVVIAMYAGAQRLQRPCFYLTEKFKDERLFIS